MIKSLSAIQETWVRSLRGEDPLQKEMATHPYVGSQRIGHDWVETLLCQQNVCLAKGIVFPVVMCRCESWTEESWVPKNWFFWTVVLEKTLESPLDCKEISLGCSLEGMMLKLKLQYFGHLMWRVDSFGKDSDAGRDWGQEEKGTTEDEMAGRHHRFDGCEFEWTPGFGDGQGGLACRDSWGHKESDTTERLNWSELNWATFTFN